jgi:hypothetical protein
MNKLISNKSIKVISTAIKANVEIPKEFQPLVKEAGKYKSAEEFANDKILFSWIKSKYLYKDIKSLADVSVNDLLIFKKQLAKEIKKYGVEDVGRQIRNSASCYQIEITDLFTKKSQLIDFYDKVK